MNGPTLLRLARYGFWTPFGRPAATTSFMSVCDCSVGVGLLPTLITTSIDDEATGVPLSVAMNVGVYTPAVGCPGVHEKTPVLVLNVAPDGRPEAESDTVSLSGSVALTVNVSVLCSRTCCDGTGVMIGALLTLPTVIVMS